MVYVAPSFRFACLQYLVAMTVIVTPCLILIGGDYSRLEKSSVECLEWNLEDEYEYRRRRFYYRCSGSAGWYYPGNDSVSEDDDSYELSADSEIDSGYSLPQKEEWIAERRHWLDQLARHRATALDKWIRTAADVKQAMGDVFGYRALMSALCSDRVNIRFFINKLCSFIIDILFIDPGFTGRVGFTSPTVHYHGCGI